MLRSLYIQNYALIEKLDIGFETGFSVITGETGAGKSIILGAIGLLLGQRADVKAIRRGASKCIIEARFDISAYGMRPFFEENELEYDDEECILRREVQASGTDITRHGRLETGLIYRHHAAAQPGNLLDIGIDTRNGNTHIGETCSRYQPDITRTYDDYIHIRN